MLVDMASDLHVDIKRNPADFKWEDHKNGGSDILMVAGDISNSMEISICALKKAAEIYTHVIFVDGNHEHYQNCINNGISITDSVSLYKKLCSDVDNIHYLTGDHIIINDVCFVGANGWYDFQFGSQGWYTPQASKYNWKLYSNDVSLKFDKNYPELHALCDASTMYETVRGCDQNPDVKHIVMMTHTIPNSGVIAWERSDPLNGAYGNSQMEMIHSNKITTWLFGHTHHSIMKDVNGITYICNPRGYPHEGSEYTFVQVDVAASNYSAFGEIER